MIRRYTYRYYFLFLSFFISLLPGCINLKFVSQTGSLNGQNLLPNPSFEAVNTCQKYNEPCCPKAWRSTTFKGFMYPEYFGKVKSISYGGTSIKPFHGDRFISLRVYHPTRAFDRSFVQVPLLCPLKKGRKYRLQIQVYTVAYQLDEIGISFDSQLTYKKDNSTLKNTTSAIPIPLSKKLIPNEWNSISLEFEAKGNESVLILGNFLSDELTILKPLIKKKVIKKIYGKSVYYSFDQITLEALEDDSITCDLATNQALIYADSVRHLAKAGITIKEKVVEVKKEIVEGLIPTLNNETATEEKVELDKKEKPVIRLDEVIKLDTIFTLSNIQFSSNSDQLLPISFESLQHIGEILINHSIYNLQIIGHTDDVGSDDFNQKLSEKRAMAVANYLIRACKVSTTQIQSIGRGETRPMRSNETEEGRSVNRRVEFLLSRKD